MNRTSLRIGLVEGVGTFGLVFFAAAVVCVNAMTTPAGEFIGRSSLTAHQPGLIGIALAQGLILAVMLEVSLACSGGYLNPAITIMLWVFNRLATRQMLGLAACQLIGALLAGGCLLLVFTQDVLESARMGTPHLNSYVYEFPDRGTQVTGAGIELILTFFLVLAIFGAYRGARDEGRGARGLWAGVTLTACVLVGFPLTGAATNPARFLGPAVWEMTLPQTMGAPAPLADVFVYVAGPVLGALLGGAMAFKVLGAGAEHAPPPRVAPSPTRDKK